MGCPPTSGTRWGARQVSDWASSGARMWRASRGLILLAGSVLCGCAGQAGRHVDPVAWAYDDPFDVVTSARIDTTYTSPYPTQALDRSAYRFRAPRNVKPPAPPWSGRPPSKLHPVLERWLADSSAALRKRFIVTFRDTLSIPRLPPPSAVTPGGGALAAAAIDGIRARRSTAYRSDSAGFAALGADVIETFWLIPAAVVEMPLGRAKDLALRRNVATIEPVVGSPPPQGYTVADIRNEMSTDPYYDVPPSGDKIALLDTGVRFTHEKLESAPIGIQGDCIGGGPDCLGGDPGDQCRRPGQGDDQGHGTGAAALISGKRATGPWRGLTRVPLDSYRVFTYDADICASLDPLVATRAIDVAVANGARVVVAEMQDTSSFFGSLAQAADQANRTGGAVVVAATGNTPGAGTVSAPASARRVLGIGAHDGNGLTFGLQSQGPTPDGRIKPDVQAPMDVVTASSASNTATRTFRGTSCATALAGASAALLREWLMAHKQSVDPGQVYAQMILSGTREAPFVEGRGAGPLRLPSGGRAWWGKVSLGHHEASPPIEIAAGDSWVDRIDVAIWWPEDLKLDSNGLPVDERNDVDLYLYDPAGNLRGVSESQGTVFERTSVHVPASRRGTWTLEIYGYETHGGQQTVYWSALARPSAPGDEPPEPGEQ